MNFSKKTKIFFLIILFFGIFGWAKSSWAAIDCDRITLSNAISTASPGDTIICNAGIWTWDSTVIIDKEINLIGAGIGNTVITRGSSVVRLLTIRQSNLSLDGAVRVSGFSFNLNGYSGLSDVGTTLVYIGEPWTTPPYTAQTKIRVDHNRFYSTSAVNQNAHAIMHDGAFYGVVDNNLFESMVYFVRTPQSYNRDAGWNYIGTTGFGVAFGTKYNLYFEDNIFNFAGNWISNGVTNCQFSGRYAYRYNTINLAQSSYPLWDVHPTRGDQSACMVIEIYGNKINTGDYGGFSQTRGGRTLYFFNYTTPNTLAFNVSQGGPASCGVTDELANLQSIHDTYIFNNRSPSGIVTPYCDVCPPWVENCGKDAYGNIRPIRPLPGIDYFYDTSTPSVGCGASLPGTCAAGQGYWLTNQSCSDLTGMVGKNPSTQISGTLYKCINNTWTAYYTPLTYPHPLRSENPCTYTYSAWGTCQPNGTQTRTYTASPAGCSGTPILSQSCEYVFSPNQDVEAEYGTLTSQMQKDTTGTYIYTPAQGSGSASFKFNITQAGQYKMKAKVKAINTGANSFFIRVDNEDFNTTTGYYIYDTSVNSFFVWDDVNRRGTGGTVSQYDPLIWTFSANTTHTFTFYGSESNTLLDMIRLEPTGTDTTPPSAPSGVMVN